jgi:hypothetical protein
VWTLLSSTPVDHTREWNGGGFAEVLHKLDLVRDLLIRKSSVSWFGESDNGVGSCIEPNMEAQVERALQITNNFLDSTSPAPTSDKGRYLKLEIQDLAQPILPLIVTTSLGNFIENGHFGAVLIQLDQPALQNGRS